MTPPPQEPPSTAAQTLNFLSNILSQRGPTSVPYTEDVKWLIRQHLVALSDAFPSLHIKSATFTHNDGRTVNLLQADGTIPMIYLNVSYNIPIIVWLMEFYPRNPPLVYVNPTRDMIIKRPHSFVTPSGMVNVPYLQNWVYPSSNLVDLVSNLGVLFASDPPLYSQRKFTPNPNLGSVAANRPNSPNPNPNFGSVGGNRLSFPNSNSNPNPNLGSIGGNRMNFPNANSNPNPSLGSIGGSRMNIPNPSSSSNSIGGRMGYGEGRTEDPTEVYKRNAINKLVEMVHGDVAGMRKEREAEMDALFSVQGEIRRREETVNRGLREMIDEKEGLENQLQMVLTNADVLEGWLRDNEEKLGKSGGGNNVDVDEVFEPCDALSKQMIEVSASDLAIEDVIYSLDKGVQDGVIPFDQYLKNVRLLSREQFFHRALSAKIRGVQMQARVNSMAARTSHFVM